jgi:putative acetyltransferase
MPEFGAVGSGYAIEDPEVDDMFHAYHRTRCAYFVVHKDGEVLGGGGIAPLEGGAHDTCELRKMYFLPELRGQGMGQKVLDLCLEAARNLRYKICYLETLKHMTQARSLYSRNGFRELEESMGATGHFSCDAWFAKDL